MGTGPGERSRGMGQEVFLPPLMFSGIMPPKRNGNTWNIGIMEWWDDGPLSIIPC